MKSKNFDFSAKLNRANKYSRCAREHCKPQKTKRFRKCSKKVVCPDIEKLQVCIDGDLHEPLYRVGNMGKMGEGEYIELNQKPLESNIGTYHYGNNRKYMTMKMPNESHYAVARKVPSSKKSRDNTYQVMNHKQKTKTGNQPLSFYVPGVPGRKTRSSLVKGKPPGTKKPRKLARRTRRIDVKKHKMNQSTKKKSERRGAQGVRELIQKFEK